MTTEVILVLSIAAAVAGCLARIASRSLRDFSRHELEELCEARQQPDRLTDILHHHDSVALGMEMAASAFFATSIIGLCIWYFGDQLFGVDGPAALTPVSTFISSLLLIVPVFLVISVWLPWSIARTQAVPFLFRAWPACRFVAGLFYPLIWAARSIDALFPGRKQGELNEETLEEEIRTIVSEGHREGLLEEEAREMIEGVIDLGDAVISHIMTPRTEMHMVPLNMPWEELVDDIIDSTHSRVPVYDKSRDDVVGILHSKDLLPELAKGPDAPPRPLAEILRKPLFVPETKPVDELLTFFQQSRTHIAVVLDEYGGVSGLVTIEDVLEEIVGEIADEYDKETEEDIRKIDDDRCEALGRAHVDQINALMGFELPESEDFDTIGGFVFAELGRVPAAGETVTWQDAVRVTVLEASRRRVNRVRLERVRKESLEMASGEK